MDQPKSQLSQALVALKLAKMFNEFVNKNDKIGMKTKLPPAQTFSSKIQKEFKIDNIEKEENAPTVEFEIRHFDGSEDLGSGSTDAIKISDNTLKMDQVTGSELSGSDALSDNL